MKKSGFWSEAASTPEEFPLHFEIPDKQQTVADKVFAMNGFWEMLLFLLLRIPGGNYVKCS